MSLKDTERPPEADYYPRRPYTFDRVVSILFTVCGLVAVLYLLNILRGVLLPFLVACLIAYMLEPMVKWNQRLTRCRTRFIPVVMTLVEMTAVLTVGCMVFVPYLVEETKQMGEMIHAYATSQIQRPYISQQVHDFIRDNIDFKQVSRLLSREQWMELARQTVSSGWSFLSSSLAFVFGVVSWLIVILYVIFIMLDYERLMLSFRQLVPMRHRRRTYAIATDIKNAMNRYFRGQFIIASLVGVLFAVGFLIIGLPMGVVLGLFIGALNMVPYLQLISLPVTALLCIVCTASTGVDFWVIFWKSMAVYVVVQCIQDLVLTPRIMGKAMGLNPAIILLSLSIWGSLLGFMGMIIALPLTTLVLSYYDQYVVRGKAREDFRSSIDDPMEE